MTESSPTTVQDAPGTGRDGGADLTAGLQRLANDDERAAPPRRAAAQLLSHRAHHRRSRDAHGLYHLVVHQLRRRVVEAAHPAHLSCPKPICRSRSRASGFCSASIVSDPDRGACRQPAGPLAHLVRRNDARSHADRAQRLSRSEADFRIHGHDGRHAAWLPEGGPDRVSLQGALVARLRHRRDQGRDQPDQAGRRGGSAHRLHADRHRAADGLHLLYAAPRCHAS